MSHDSASRFLLAEEIAPGAVQPWRFAVLGVLAPAACAPAAAPEENPVVLADITPDEPRVQAWLEEARAQGYAAGVQDARRDTTQALERQWQQRMDEYVSDAERQAAARLQSAGHLLRQLDAEVQQLRGRVAREVLHLACDIARQVVRQELRGQPQALLGVVREALEMLAAAQQPASVHLHPDDLAALQPLLDQEALEVAAAGGPKIQWLADPGLHPGDALIGCAGTQIDASVQKRWQRAVAALGLIGSWYDPMASCAAPA